MIFAHPIGRHMQRFVPRRRRRPLAQGEGTLPPPPLSLREGPQGQGRARHPLRQGREQEGGQAEVRHLKC